MKAYVYRSGHVMIGRTVPEGAIELAEWDNEAELLMVCRWLFPMAEDAEGQPTMVDTTLARFECLPEENMLIQVVTIQKKLTRSLKDLREHPVGPILFHVGAVERWSDSAVAHAQEATS